MSACFPCQAEIRKHSIQPYIPVCMYTHMHTHTHVHACTHTLPNSHTTCQRGNEEFRKFEQKLVLLLPLLYNVVLCSNSLFEHMTIFIINYLCAQVCSRGWDLKLRIPSQYVVCILAVYQWHGFTLNLKDKSMEGI